MKASLILSALASICLLSQAQSSGGEEKLAKFLMEKIEKLGSVARPAVRATDSVSVDLQLTLLRVETVRRGAAELDGWLKMSWKDPRLTWSSSSFGGLSSLAVPPNSLWLPDIRAYNVLGFQPDKEGPIRVAIFKDGSIIYVLPSRIRFQCQDRPGSTSCQVKFGSWVYNDKQVDIKLTDKPIDLTDFEDNDWGVSNATAARVSKVYPCCKEAYTSVHYKLMLTQKGSRPQK